MSEAKADAIRAKAKELGLYSVVPDHLIEAMKADARSFSAVWCNSDSRNAAEQSYVVAVAGAWLDGFLLAIESREVPHD